MIIIRLPNGYGSVYRLSGKRRRPFVARITTGWTDEGVQKFEILGYFEKSVDALAALAQHHKTPISNPNITLEGIYDEWSKEKFKELTLRTSRNVIKAAWNYLSSASATKMRELRANQIQDIIDDCSRKRDTKADIKGLALSLFAYAMQNDVVHKNYAEFLKLPKGETEEKEPFSDLELLKIEKAAADGVPFADCVLIMCYTGWRIGEFLALTRFSYNEKEQTLTGGSKTEAGKNRIIPIHPKIQKYVKLWVDKGGDRIFCKDDSKPYSQKQYKSKCYFPALKLIEIRDLTPHACRHTFGTILDKAGVGPEDIKRLMGHSSYAFTVDRYTHPGLESLRKAVEMI